MQLHPSRRRRRASGARTLWSLAVLAMLRERPMHPYEMQRVMHQRHTDELLALKRGSLYHAINQLQRESLIEPIETSREGRRPERTVYQITPDGNDELVLWMRELLSAPAHEPSQFTAALAFIRNLPPADALDQLELRAVDLEAGIAAMHAIERGISAYVDRVSVLELEYQRALAQAELAWVRGLVDDLRANNITWSLEEINVSVPAMNSDLHTSEVDP
jgi:DNA-binding PadR family transcriptional regulator